MYFARRVQAVSSTVVISEFRTVGPNGGNDEFIELYNLSNGPVDISGWTIRGSNNAAGVSIRLTVNAGTTIPAHGHFLATNSAASGYSGSVPGNQTYTTGITNDGGIAIFNSSATIVDQVGMSTGSAYKEGTVLTALTTNTNRGYERKPGGANGSTQDTDNNATDFQLLSPSDPQNLSSPATPPVNQGINTTCPNPPSTTQGTATSVGVSASDPDGTVTSASIISAPVTGISLDNFTQAPNVAGTANATLNVANTTAAGTYNVTIRWSNNDSPTPQTADCIVVVTVTPPNQPIAPSCPASLSTTQGTATSAGVSATDPDGTVTSASITSSAVPGITLDSFTPAAGVGGTASATLNVANTTAVGTYNVTIQYANNDSPTPQTATCTVVVSVNTPPPPPGSVVISQVYGGGGNSGATLKNDFIEIINHTGAPINLAGWSVQYISPTATSGLWAVTPLTSFILQPGQYYLIKEAAQGGGTVDLPTPDATGTIPMGATAGKVALVSNTTALSGAGCPSGAALVDLVGYGGTANCFEGAGPAPTLTNTTAELRKDNGCTDTDNNNTDLASGAPNPRNSSSPTNNCAVLKGAGSADPFGVQQGGTTNLTVVVSPGSDPPSTGITVSADLSSIGGAANQPFSGSGNTFTYFATVSNSAPLGNKLLPVTISDAQGRNANTTIALVVQQPHVVISQVYGGGGNGGATYTNDFVELYNPTGVTFDLSDYSLQYTSATGDGWEFTRQPLGGTIGPGEYYLIALGSGGSDGSALPAANINSDINIATSNGKLALVNSFEPLIGNCPLGDATIQDFVGYGSTADCSESANAPGPGNNTSSLFRKNNGATDTDNNSADFLVATPPNPRRTAPIVEIGPSVFGTDPRRNGLNAPRDASMTITFTEAVDVSGSWYNISCATTGVHNDATVASTPNFKTYVITPNVNFLAGEQCTVTLYKDQISDQDSDDAGTNTDHLRADYAWSFTVATGTAPPYPPDVHLTMGNPNGATADTGQPDNYLMEKPEFALSYNRDLGRPNWVSWHLSDEWVGSLTRVDSFRPDPGVPPDWYRVQATDFSGSGFDRGHMTPNADRDKETSIPINQATFLMSNMVAQSPDNNQGPWAAFENYLRTLLPANEVYIVSGPYGVGGTGSNGGTTTTLAAGHVTVPASTWKVALVIPKASGDDISRVMCNSTTVAVSMPNMQGIRNDPWQNYLTTVDLIENQTTYNFFSNLPAGIQNCIESGVNGTGNHPGTEGQSVTTNEETAVAITLTAESANANPLTYTIVSGPSHGGLSGTGANRTYTPDLNYFGSDSFTFKVNDGVNDSNTSTVTITVNNVEDAPDAVDDTPTIAEDSGANVINVLGNDTDVDNDTLTVTAVTQGSHGSVTNNGPSVSYTPNSNFFGTDTFTYTISDGNGGTDTATVNVTVTNVEDAPDAVDDTPTIAEDSGANVINVLGNDTDVDNDTLTVTAVTQGSHGSVANNGTSVSYTPNSNFFGTDTFTYTISDGHGGTDTATVNVTITNVNDAPVATNDNYVTNSNTTLNVAAPGVLSNDNDIDGPSLSAVYVAASGPSHGTLSLSGNGSFSYAPSANYSGPDSFSYRAFDGSDYSNVATVTITVNDTVAPTLNSTLAINLLTSTNSDLINVGLNATATDNSGTPVQIQVAVFGDEDDETPTKQNILHSPDAKDIGPDNTLRLRAERVEANDGRVYLIIVTATDTSGNVSRSYHTVVVPKSNKQANIDSVNAQAAAAVSYAQTHNGAPPPGYFVIGDGPIIGPKQ